MRGLAAVLIFAASFSSAWSQDNPVMESLTDDFEVAYFSSVFSADYSIELAGSSAAYLDDCSLAYHLFSTGMLQTTNSELAVSTMRKSGVFKSAATIARISGLDTNPPGVTPFRDVIFGKLEAPLDLMAHITPKLEECDAVYQKAADTVSSQIEDKQPVAVSGVFK